jgi:hypothetical protein
MMLVTTSAVDAGSAPPPPCDAVRVVDAASLGASWRQALVDLRAQVRKLGPAECVEVTLVLAADGERVRLIASTLDGRHAERRVAQASSLVPIALGLITSAPPEGEQPAEGPAPPPPSAAELPPPDVPVARAVPAEPPAPPRVQVAVAVAVGARAGFPTRVAMMDLEARADVIADGWLVAASLRYSPFGVRSGGASGYTYDEVALGLGFGRRVMLGDAALDLTVAPELVVMTQELDAPTDGAGGVESEARLGATARLRLPFGTRWRPLLAIDADLAPLSRALVIDSSLPPLPTWTLGLAAGALGDLL